MTSQALNILLVEDNEDDLLVFRRAFAKSSYEARITPCAQAEEALDLLSRNKDTFDILITDYVLPGMSGVELCNALHDRGVFLPVVMMTGILNERVAEDALKAGASGHVIKDFGVDYLRQLPETVMETFHRHTHRMERQRAGDPDTRMGRVLENSFNEIYFFDAETLCFTQANRGARENLGYSMEELALLTPLDLKPELTAATFAELLAPLRDGEQRLVTFETVHRRKDGTLYDVSIRLQFSPEESPPVFVSIIEDITERKKTEAEARFHETLAMEAQKTEALGRLAGGIAHHFNNALFGMLGLAELAMDDLPETSEAHAKLARLRQVGAEARGLVDQMAAFARKEDPTYSPMSLAPVIEEVLLLLRATLPANITVRTEISPECGIVRADAGQIRQLVVNLATNAADAMYRENGILTIALDHKKLSAPLAAWNLWVAPGDYIRLSVADTGRGMNREILDQIFDPFFTTKKVGEGSGMGLAVVHGITGGHNGALNVTTREGEGSVFEIYLPLAKEDTPDETEDMQSSA